MENTSLTFLASDGLFTATLSPRLTNAQYGELGEIVAKGNYSKAAFCEHFANLAATWGIKFSAAACD